MANKQMKPHHAGAMKSSHESHKRSHFATGLGVSEAEKAPIGHGEFANMPQQVHMEAYPKAARYRGGVLDDTITGIDRTNHMAEEKSQRFLSNQH